MALTADQVLELAPDPAARLAAAKHAVPTAWRGLARDERAVWGEIRGSALYQVRADLTDLASKCSCPSRKIPCKHSLGLLLVAAHHLEKIPVSDKPPPEWVMEWMERRTARKNAPAAEPDLEARAKRVAERERKVDLGVEGLMRWLEDLARTGLASFVAQGAEPFDAQAARLVDAQATGLASRVRRVGARIGTSADWPERTAADLGRLTLLATAWQRRAVLPPALLADVAQLVGFPTTEESVRTSDRKARDRWAVVGRALDEDERLHSERTFLVGQSSGRTAMVLQFAPIGASFSERFVEGTCFDGELAFYPGAVNRRALVMSRDGPVAPLDAPWAAHPDIATFLEAHAELMAKAPWLDRSMIALADVIPIRKDGAMWLADKNGAAVPLLVRDPWRLLALSGGHPITIAGEWDGERAWMIAAWSEGAHASFVGGPVEEET